jgi:uncharacterized protein YegJ (DUF2314 family)
MPFPLKIILFAALCVALWLFLRWRYPKPDYAPLETKPDDPLLMKAMDDARKSLSEFRTLLSEPRESALIKLHFVSSSDQVEHLWAEVVEVINPQELGVRLVTPPVTHSGELDRLHRCTFEDIEDWQVRDSNGKVHGGFTQRAMFAIAKRDGIKLPKKLTELEREYGDA